MGITIRLKANAYLEKMPKPWRRHCTESSRLTAAQAWRTPEIDGSVNFSRLAAAVASSFVVPSLRDPERLPHRLRSSHSPPFSAEAAGQSSIRTLLQLPPFPFGLSSDLQLRTRLFACPS